MKSLPPYAHTLGLSVVDTEDGAPVLAMGFSSDVLGRPGFIHGGAIGGMLEMAAIAALYSQFDDDDTPRFKPINVTVDYMRGGRDKETRAIGRVTRVGTRIANVEAIAWQDDRSKPIAAARMNILIVRGAHK
ncbi:PaaI family thioesterase [Sphingomonas sp. LaA6.9]|uniref:PaaI family thioesterase n=1 Tax=Sphingomonas sp. LaA6.9 TaxID=2919914 RepID=UPI001F4F31B7|nr:PaaI family thioesterase [Sphingomonas sp. LaA6.9]MCJ8158130.1 PaaI family thioesterase [Sphingomonas sp. LaA6.9]